MPVQLGRVKGPSECCAVGFCHCVASNDIALKSGPCWFLCVVHKSDGTVCDHKHQPRGQVIMPSARTCRDENNVWKSVRDALSRLILGDLPR